MELQHFGLRHSPLGKETRELWDDGMLTRLRERFQWLLQSPGIGLLTGEAGVGKTAALRAVTATLNPHRYQVIYHAETDFGRLDLYRCLAQSLGLAPSYRRALLWREISQCMSCRRSTCARSPVRPTRDCGTSTSPVTTISATRPWPAVRAATSSSPASIWSPC
jgi:hypothetical protein